MRDPESSGFSPCSLLPPVGQDRLARNRDHDFAAARRDCHRLSSRRHRLSGEARTGPMSSARFMMIPGAPAPVAPFSHAVEVDGWVFLTGQMPTDPHDDNAPLPAGIKAQTRRVMDNLALVLHGVKLGVEHVVAARVFLTHFERDYGPMNQVYRTYFPEDRLPARTCVGVTALARGALVEIDFIARR